jgi:hypothetical protein
VIPGSRYRRRLVVSLLLASLLVAGTTVVAVGSHDDRSDDETGASDFRVATYGGATAEQRAPGATDRNYWSESIIYGLPDEEPVYLTETITYRPIPSDCAPEDTDEFGVDRNATYEGERRIDDSATESVKSFAKEDDARAGYERKYGADGSLTTTDWEYVEKLTVEWYAPDEFGAPLEIRRGDRFVSAQRGCLDNPDAAGWYRFASINTAELENGTTITQDRPTFSHWFYVCDCESREVAVETLGPPPSAATDDGTVDGDAGTPTPPKDTASMPTATATGTGAVVDVNRDSSMGGRPTDETPTSTLPRTASDGTASVNSGETPSAGSASTTTPGWDERVIRTPTAADGSGFTPLFALVGALVAYVLGRRH